jgi:hypothetical protein
MGRKISRRIGGCNPPARTCQPWFDELVEVWIAAATFVGKILLIPYGAGILAGASEFCSAGLIFTGSSRNLTQPATHWINSAEI